MEDKSYNIQSGGNMIGEMTHPTGLEIVKDIAHNFGLTYRKPNKDETNHWYGTAAPIISFLNMFKVRLNELRVGHGTFTIQKDAKSTRVTSSSYYGFYSVHHPLLEGITIPPEKKSRMAQSLRPLTSLICLARSDNDQKYSRRWRAAVKRVLSFLPEIDSVIEACCGKPAGEVKGLYTLIGDIVLITTSREAKRAYFPACMMYLLVLLSKPEQQHYIANRTLFTEPTDISWFNFSGVCPIREDGANFLPKIIFHSIWETYGTDFGILEYMTGYRNWSTRNKIGDSFKKMGSSETRSVRLLSMNKYSKMSSANQTGLLALSSNPIVGKSAFSGKYKQVFIDYLDSSKTTTAGVTKNIETLRNLMMQTRESLKDHIANNRTQDRGTTKWHSMDDCTKTTYGKELDDIPSVRGMLFMQGNK